jgi:hypothetical protein
MSSRVTPIDTPVLNNERLQVAAEERTFDGAYTRTVFNAIATGLVVYRVFGRDFSAIGLVMIVFGVLLYFVSLWRRRSIGRFLDVEGSGGGHEDEEVDIGPGPSSTTSIRVRSTSLTDHFRELRVEPVQPTQLQLRRLVEQIKPVRRIVAPETSAFLINESIESPQPQPYLKWRRKHGGSPLSLYYKTHGEVVLVTASMTLVVEIIILVLLWKNVA